MWKVIFLYYPPKKEGEKTFILGVLVEMWFLIFSCHWNALVQALWHVFWSMTIICYAKSLQLCPTLCDPIDGSPPGSPVPGILHARTLEWAAISFSNAWKWKVKVKSLSRVRLLATPWIAAMGCRFLHPWDFLSKSTGVGCHDHHTSTQFLNICCIYKFPKNQKLPKDALLSTQKFE